MLVLYAVKAKALELFRIDVPTVRAVRNDFKTFCRSWVCGHLHEGSTDLVIEEWGATVRGRMELIRAYAQPLTATEQSILAGLMNVNVSEGRFAERGRAA